MDSKTKVKEEVDLLEEDKHFSSSNPERVFENDATSQYDFKMDHKINIKEEVDISEPGLPNESLCFPTDFGNKFKNETVTCSDFELGDNTESKEWADTCFQKEEKCFSSDLVKKIKKEFISCNENDEVSVEITSECQSEPSDSLPSENKDGKAEAADSYRLIVHTTCPETAGVEAMGPSTSIYSHRSKKNIENCKTCVSAGHSKKQGLNSDTGIHCEHFGEIFPGKSGVKLSDLIREEKEIYNCDICQKSFNLRKTLKSHRFIHEDKKALLG